MRTRTFTLRLGAATLTYAALALVGNPAFAVEYWLRAGATSVNMPNPNGGPAIPVAMWGYAQCTPGPLSATCGTVTVPGPALTVPPGDPTLTVHLLNSLSVPTSLVINGLIKTMAPVWDNGSPGARPSLTARVRSFDAEAAPNGVADYTWNNVRPGTYLYQSGTRPQVQVQMGLYGAATKNVADSVAATGITPAIRGQAYGAGYEFDNEATLLYSEIDPALHDAVATGTYGTAAGPSSTINYTPKYFLINGQPYPLGATVIEPTGSPGTTLLRLLNAGLTTHVPMIQGKHWDLIGEDGKAYPYRRTQYTALLSAAKTVDVLFTPEVGVTYPIMDRRLSLSNNGLMNGGMLAYLRFASLGSMATGGGAGGNQTPVATNDTYDSVKGVTLNIAAAGVLGNDSDPDNTPTPVQTVRALAASGTTANNGTFTLNANGSFSYTPLATYVGASDSFTYQATDGKALSPAATVTINLLTPAAPALGALDSFATADSSSLGASWSQQVETTTSVPDVGITAGRATANATALGGLAIWNASFELKQGAGATLSANAYLVLKASGGTALAPANYVRVGCESGQIVVSTLMGGSNISVYAKQAAFGSCGATGNALNAVVDAKGLVTVFDSTGYIGGVQLPDVAAWKVGGRIGIQLTAVGATADDFTGGTIAP